MDITIFSLDLSIIDKLTTQDMDIYSRVIRKATDYDPTCDLLINLAGLTVTEHHMLFTFPNGNQFFIEVPSNYYHKIEVM